MRKLFIILIILMVVGCAHRPSYSPQLLGIERDAGKNPVASLQKLEDCSKGLRSKPDSMLYVLLYSESARAMGMTFNNEDWISPAVEFFDSIGDDDRAVRSMLMLALCYYDDGKLDKAAEWLMKTRDHDDGNNPLLRFQLYLTLGDINNVVGRQEEKNNDYRNAYLAAVNGKDKEKQITALYRLAVSYFNGRRIDSLKGVVDRLNGVGGQSESDKSMSQTAEGMYCLLRNDTAKALDMFTKSQNYDADFRAAYISADILYKKGIRDEAENLWLIAANSADRNIAINALSRLIDNAEPTEYKLRLSQMLNKLYAEKPTEEETAKVIEMQKQFDEMSQEEKSKHKIIFLSIVVMSLLVVIAFISASVFMRKKKRMEKEKAWDIDRELLSSEVTQSLHGLAATGNKASADKLNELDNLISDHDPRLSSLLQENKELTAADRHVAQLIRLRFQPSEIVALLDLSPQRVTNTRSRLLQRLFDVKGGAKEFDKRIRDL